MAVRLVDRLQAGQRSAGQRGQQLLPPDLGRVVVQRGQHPVDQADPVPGSPALHEARLPRPVRGVGAAPAGAMVRYQRRRRPAGAAVGVDQPGAEQLQVGQHPGRRVGQDRQRGRARAVAVGRRRDPQRPAARPRVPVRGQRPGPAGAGPPSRTVTAPADRPSARSRIAASAAHRSTAQPRPAAPPSSSPVQRGDRRRPATARPRTGSAAHRPCARPTGGGAGRGGTAGRGGDADDGAAPAPARDPSHSARLIRCPASAQAGGVRATRCTRVAPSRPAASYRAREMVRPGRSSPSGAILGMCQRSRSGARWRRSARTRAASSRPWVRATERRSRSTSTRAAAHAPAQSPAARRAVAVSIMEGGTANSRTRSQKERRESPFAVVSEHQHSPCADGTPNLSRE